MAAQRVIGDLPSLQFANLATRCKIGVFDMHLGDHARVPRHFSSYSPIEEQVQKMEKKQDLRAY